MSNFYFNCARESGCVGLEKDMGGFHKCATLANCLKPKKAKTSKRLPKKSRKEKITEVVTDAIRAEPELADVIADVVEPRRSSRVRMAVGSGRTSPWIDHVKGYQQEHNCSYKEALIGASKTYH